MADQERADDGVTANTTRLDPVDSTIAPVTRQSPARRAEAAHDDPASLREWELEAADIATRLEREPADVHMWGISVFVADDEPEIQAPAFYWFESRSDLMKYVRTNLPLNARRFAEDDPFVLRARVEEVVNDVAEGSLEGDEALPLLNDLLAPYASIEWWGKYVDLLQGDGSFERDLRRWFRERSGEADAIESEFGGLTPITEGELEEFAAALADYGALEIEVLPRERSSGYRRPNPEALTAADTLENDERFATIDDVIEGEGDADAVLEGGAQGLHAAEAEDLVITDLDDPTSPIASAVASDASRGAAESVGTENDGASTRATTG